MRGLWLPQARLDSMPLSQGTRAKTTHPSQSCAPGTRRSGSASFGGRKTFPMASQLRYRPGCTGRMARWRSYQHQSSTRSRSTALTRWPICCRRLPIQRPRRPPPIQWQREVSRMCPPLHPLSPPASAETSSSLALRPQMNPARQLLRWHLRSWAPQTWAWPPAEPPSAPPPLVRSFCAMDRRQCARGISKARSRAMSDLRDSSTTPSSTRMHLCSHPSHTMVGMLCLTLALYRL
mmetsp:Transcript_32834/g.86297  ORF Transcript_32834/g.86297 Transcript_32834/m.86297 type:complete len:235 (+) Transcript_32834:498-1202(+)